VVVDAEAQAHEPTSRNRIAILPLVYYTIEETGCQEESDFNLGIIVVFLGASPVGASSDKSYTSQIGKTPSSFMRCLFAPSVAQSIPVDDVPIEKQNIRKRSLVDRTRGNYRFGIDALVFLDERATNTERILGRQEPTVGQKERGVPGWIEKSLSGLVEAMGKATGDKLCWRSAGVLDCNPKTTGYARFPIFVDRNDKPGTFGMNNGLSIEQCSLSRLPCFPRLPSDNQGRDDSDDYQRAFRGSAPMWCLILG